MSSDKNDYYIGLDIGTDSDGWAVADEQYNIIKAHGEHLWGARLFDKASDASERRTKRSARRRLARKRLETQWLQEIFAKEIDKVDKNFFVRLNNSSLFVEDKNEVLSSKDSIFFGLSNGKSYCDKDYYKDYKTIYDLRKELLTSPAKDVRLLYLALYSILKSRGHFVTGTDFSNDSGDNLVEKLNTMLHSLENITEDETIKKYVGDSHIDDNKMAKLTDAIKESKYLSDCKEKFKEILGIAKENKKLASIADSLVNGSLNVLSIFDIEETDDLKELKKVNFQDANYDEKYLGLMANNLKLEEQDLVEQIKNIYSLLQLQKLLGGANYVCEAMVKKYRAHGVQLKLFKNFVKKYYSKQYFDIFRNPHFNKKGQCNYAQYVNVDKINGKKLVLGLDEKGKAVKFARTRVEFYGLIKSILSQTPEIIDETFESQKQEYLSLIEKNEFLPKQRTIDNAVIPNALLIKEAKQILETNRAKYQFLCQKDERGLDNEQKILQIMKFRVPYYVGPIIGNTEHTSENAWCIKTNSDKRLYPWTFDEIVDRDASEQMFISRMLNKCTYLHKFFVLPKSSIIYQKYLCLNELNNLKLHDKKIDIELKQKIFEDVYKNFANVSLKLIKSYLLQNGTYKNENEIEISGLSASGKLEHNFSSFVAFKNIFGDNFNIEMAEYYIRLCTVLSEKSRIMQNLQKRYPQLTAEQISKIKNLNFEQKWGELSKEFLQGEKCGELVFIDTQTGEQTDIIDRLYNTQDNLMQIINDKKYVMQFLSDNKKVDIIDGIRALNYDEKTELEYEDVDNLYCSPSVKRATWQTIKVLKEIIETIKKYKPEYNGMPKKVFVEVTRDDDGTVQKDSRANRLKKLYSSKEIKQSLDSIGIDLLDLQNQLNKMAESPLEFRSDKLFLYFMQAGRCAYTGKKIDIGELFNDNFYDIDHIIPQSLIKDDSLDNRVLVCKECNEEKKDSEIVLPQYQQKMKYFWNVWKNLGLLSQKKFERLTRTEPFTEKDLDGFIERQLVETNQTTKAVIELLKNYFGDTTQIIFSKASLVSEFRKRYDIIKCREINDFHHAKDAYLNIVVGNGFNSKFSSNYQNYVKDYKKLNDMLSTSADAVEKGIKFYFSDVEDKSQIEDINSRKKSSQTIKISGMQPVTEIVTVDNKTYYTFDNNKYFTKRLNLRTKIFDNNIYDYTTKQCVWNVKTDLKKVYDICYRNDCIVSNMSLTNENSGFYDETLYKSNIHCKYTNAKISQKQIGKLNDINKYGGYDSEKVAYFMIVDSEDKKGNNIRTIESVTSFMYQRAKGDNQKIFEYVVKQNNLKNAKCIVDKVNIQTTMLYNGGKFLLAGKTSDSYILHNMNEFYADKSLQKYFKVLTKFRDIEKKNYIKDTKDIQKLFDALGKYNNADIQNFDKLDCVVLSPSKIKGSSLELVKVENIKVYDELLATLNKKTYCAFSTVRETMANGRNKFLEISIFQQAETLIELSKIISTGSGIANLSYIDGSLHSGLLTLSKNITGKNIKLIFNSTTGLYKKIISL